MSKTIQYAINSHNYPCVLQEPTHKSIKPGPKIHVFQVIILMAESSLLLLHTSILDPRIKLTVEPRE